MAGNKNSGRKPGALNKATREIKELCKAQGPGMVNELVRLAKEADSDGSKIAAIKEILDRGYGKAKQPLDGDGEGGDIKHKVVVEFIRAAAHHAIEHRDD